MQSAHRFLCAAMGLLSRFRTAATDAAPSRAALVPGRGADLWRRGHFGTHPAGEDLQIVYSRGETPQTLPTFAVDFALSCKTFRPLEEHLEDFASKHDWNTLQCEALRAWLPQLIAAHALLSGEELRRRCASLTRPGEKPPPIGAIGFPTGGDRSKLLARAVRSFAENAHRYGHEVDMVIADSSARAVDAEQMRAAVATLAASESGRFLFIGEPEKRTFCELLARETGCDISLLEFALLDPFGTGFACGANRNALLLQQAGELLCSVDDDVVCQLSTPAGSEAQLSSFSQFDPFVRRFFTDRASALAAARWQDVDFLGAHQEMLGHDLGNFFGPNLEADDLDLAHVGDHFLGRIERPRAVIRTTFTGHVGDPGMPTSVYYLYAEGESRQTLPREESAYRAAMASRSVLTCVRNRAIGDESVSPGMAMGLDHRELLPPFFPVLHAEDYVFGATVWQCCPEAVAGHLPMAVLHEPPGGKPVILLDDLNRDRRALVFEFAHVLRRIVLDDFEPAENASAGERTEALGRHLVERAGMPPPDFVEYLRHQTLSYESSKIAYLGEQLRNAPDAAPCWRRDVETYIEHCRMAVTFEDFDIPFDMKRFGSSAEIRVLIQSLIDRYGRLLQAWPTIVEATKKLRASGKRLATHLG
jgi:hypothetical protein